jgi:hypothetical protein
MDDAGIKREITRELMKEIVQDAAIAAVPVDDHEVARRQRAHDIARQIADERDEIRDAERERARRPVVLARQAHGDGRQLPQIELVAPARDDAARELLGHDHVGVEREMRAVLLDGADRQTEDRGLPQSPGHLGKCEVPDRPAARIVQGLRGLSPASASAPRT